MPRPRAARLARTLTFTLTLTPTLTLTLTPTLTLTLTLTPTLRSRAGAGPVRACDAYAAAPIGAAVGAPPPARACFPLRAPPPRAAPRARRVVRGPAHLERAPAAGSIGTARAAHAVTHARCLLAVRAHAPSNPTPRPTPRPGRPTNPNPFAGHRSALTPPSSRRWVSYFYPYPYPCP